MLTTKMQSLLSRGFYANQNMRLLPTLSNMLKVSNATRNIKTKNNSCSLKTLSSSFNGNVTYLKPVGIMKIQHRTCTTEPESQKKTTALSVIKDLKHLGSSPAASLVTGLGGLIPFVSAPAYMLIAGYYSPFIAFSQVAYGASILSFLGGIRWGLTLPEYSGVEPSWFNIGYSVTPSLLAWVGLMFPSSMALCTLMLGLGGSLYMDLTLYGYPPWFRALRFVLTIFAILSLWTTLVLRFTLKSYEDKKAVPAQPKPEITASKVFEGATTELVKSAGNKIGKLAEEVKSQKLEASKEKPEISEVIPVVGEPKEIKDTDGTAVDTEDVKELKE